MDITPTLKRMTAAALLAGGLAVSGLGHTGAIAHADDTFAPHHWCPGQRTDPPTGPGQVVWDWHVCHTFFFTNYGMGNLVNLLWARRTAQAGPLRWCTGDPQPKALLPTPGGGWAPGPVNPAWDTNVCHDYAVRDNEVAEGIDCPLPQSQVSVPASTTPDSQMPHIPDR